MISLMSCLASDCFHLNNLKCSKDPDLALPHKDDKMWLLPKISNQGVHYLQRRNLSGFNC